jgi:CDP-paratose 2-epimerase
MKYLITGGCGFAGSNLAAEVINKNEQLFIIDNFYRKGSKSNFNWLKNLGDFTFFEIDIRNSNDIEPIIEKIQPDVIFHMCGQVAMTTSIKDPKLDFEINVLGTFNLLEAVRKYSPESIILYSSTNKVYGDFKQLSIEETDKRYLCKEYPDGIDENYPIDFHSPYGCSKGSADQYLLDYYRIYNIKTVVFRHSSMYGGRQFATYDQGWIGWFCQKAIDIQLNVQKEPFTISGDGKQVRDVLHSGDIVSLYFKTIENIESTKGEAFNIGGGMANSLSLLELFDLLEKELNIKMKYKYLPWRESDQKFFVANLSKIRKKVKWEPKISKESGIIDYLKWLKEGT